MRKSEQSPQQIPRTTSLPDPNAGNNRGTGPRKPGQNK